MPDISIVIVSYNVEDYLKNCVESILLAKGTLQTEIIIVDNHSVDESVKMIKYHFPAATLIENSENRGFAVACNQ